MATITAMKGFRPGSIIPCDEPEKVIIPHFHIFDSAEGVIFDITWKICGLKCRCGSMVTLG